MTDQDLPALRTEVPGPKSRELGRRLRQVESRNVTRIDRRGPIFWSEAAGATVVDVDGNRFVDLTAGFGVAAAGHANAAVAAAVAEQSARLPHAMGDVHPAAAKVELLERLAGLAPGDLEVSILAANGSDAVEAALKTAVMATGRPGVVAFEGGYHGLGYGALSVAGLERFREPFERQLYRGVRFAPFPGDASSGSAPTSEEAVDTVRRQVLESPDSADPVGAVIVEPIQGRAGIRVPPDGFLPALRDLCSELGVLLILDEIYTGLGRTGRWFACDHEGVIPDLLLIGKSLGGGLPLSAVVGTAETMAAWPESTGEAIHTSTFLGNPVACAAAVAHLREIDEGGLVDRAEALGAVVEMRMEEWVRSRGWAASHRGKGLMRAIRLDGADAPQLASEAMAAALRKGVLILPEGDALAVTPPLVITEAQLDYALDVLEDVLHGLVFGDVSG